MSGLSVSRGAGSVKLGAWLQIDGWFEAEVERRTEIELNGQRTHGGYRGMGVADMELNGARRTRRENTNLGRIGGRDPRRELF